MPTGVIGADSIVMTDFIAAFERMKRDEPAKLAATLVLLLGLATIGGAWFFQLVIGLPPCPLCLEQRYAYYFAIPLAALVLLGLSFGASRKVLVAAPVSNGNSGPVRRIARARFPISALPAVCSTR